MGFRPYTGVGATHIYLKFVVTTALGTNTFVGDVMDLDGTSITPAAADAGVSVIGVCTQLFDTNGVSIGHPNSAVTTKYLPASTAGIIEVCLATPGALFICQDDASATLTAADVGITFDHVAGTGDTTTSVSRHEMNATAGGLQLRLLGLVDEPNNAWGVNADIIVVFNESAVGGAAATAAAAV